MWPEHFISPDIEHLGHDNNSQWPSDRTQGDDRLSLKRAWPFGDEERDRCVAASLSASASLPASIPEFQEFQVSGISRDIEPAEAEPYRDNEYVCYGSITDVKAQLLGGKRYSLPQVTYGATIELFSVTREGSYFALENAAGNQFARLNKQACSLLRALNTEPHVTFIASLPSAGWMSILVSYQSNSSAQPIVTLDVNIMGRKADAEKVGRLLSAENTHLQFPRFGCVMQYYNPHFFRIDGYSDQIPTFLTREPPSSKPNVQTQALSEDPKASDKAVVESILDSLTHRVDVTGIKVDRRIKSVLLPHQKEAIDFVDRREKGVLVSDISLWQYNNGDGEEPFYRHVWTGAKRPERNEERGGIIADEMGLGKSLVMISTIAGSLDRAEFFRDAGSQSFAASPSQKVRTKATLVVAPSSLLIDSWVDEIRKHTYTGAMSFHRHIGSTRHTETNCLQTSMIVFTTYATIAMELSRGINSLPQLHWFRIVLDEAHDIRNKATKQYHAISNLSAEHRWCLTGTPIQNSLDDLGALIAFLKVPILEHAPAFRKFITTPILSESGRRKDRFKNLQLLLQTLCLRRTRELLDLPKPITQERRLQLSLQEQAEYREILQRCRSDIDMAVSGRGKAKVNSTVLESLLKLRLYCNNGMATNMQVTTLERLPADPDEILSLLQQMDRNVCAYCSGAIYSINPAADADGGLLLPNCKHMVCRTCMVQHRFHKQQCPTCASGGDDPMPGDSANFEAARYESPSHPIFYPTKLRSLFTDISREPLEKSIVFSSWKKTLTLFGKLLSHHDAHYAMIDGSLSLSERLKVLKDFRSPTGANMLLMTLGTGAVGLNLAVASRIYLLEPQWNPMIESQAIGRALRLGQTAQVVIVRYIMEDTVEESNVLSRQRTKLQLAGSGFGRSKEASSEQLQAMLNIFGIDSGI